MWIDEENGGNTDCTLPFLLRRKPQQQQLLLHAISNQNHFVFRKQSFGCQLGGRFHYLVSRLPQRHFHHHCVVEVVAAAASLDFSSRPQSITIFRRDIDHYSLIIGLFSDPWHLEICLPMEVSICNHHHYLQRHCPTSSHLAPPNITNSPGLPTPNISSHHSPPPPIRDLTVE